MLFGLFKPDAPSIFVLFAGTAALQKAILPPSAAGQLQAQEPRLYQLPLPQGTFQVPIITPGAFQGD